MKRSTRTNRIVLGLAILALVQIGILAIRSAPRGSPVSVRLEAGDSLGSIQPLDAQGRVVSLKGPSPTVLLVFHSECGYCQDVASLWKSWISNSTESVRIVALSAESPSNAETYAARQGWLADVWTLESRAEKGAEAQRALARRTPWVFVLDPHGVILTEGHGSRIGEITEVLNRPGGDGS